MAVISDGASDGYIRRGRAPEFRAAHRPRDHRRLTIAAWRGLSWIGLVAEPARRISTSRWDSSHSPLQPMLHQ